MSTSTTPTSTDEVVNAAATSALRACDAAVGELGRALADLRDTLPGDLRADGERAFMNAFGNAVWAAGHAARSSVDRRRRVLDARSNRP